MKPLESRHTFAITSPSALLALTLLSCGDCNFERKRAEAFLADDANQHCEKDADCTAATVNCLELESAFCGQVAMSRKAEQSPRWQDIRDELADCLGADSCSTCGALLVPTCSKGSCR
jgi:hypothetical protein